jgi:hypothetical protein
MSGQRRLVAIVRETITGYHVTVWVRWPAARHVLASAEVDSLAGGERFVHQCAAEIGVRAKRVDIFRRRADGRPFLPQQQEQASATSRASSEGNLFPRWNPPLESQGDSGR